MAARRGLRGAPPRRTQALLPLAGQAARAGIAAVRNNPALQRLLLQGLMATGRAAYRRFAGPQRRLNAASIYDPAYPQRVPRLLSAGSSMPYRDEAKVAVVAPNGALGSHNVTEFGGVLLLSGNHSAAVGAVLAISSATGTDAISFGRIYLPKQSSATSDATSVRPAKLSHTLLNGTARLYAGGYVFYHCTPNRLPVIRAPDNNLASITNADLQTFMDSIKAAPGVTTLEGSSIQNSPHRAVSHPVDQTNYSEFEPPFGDSAQEFLHVVLDGTTRSTRSMCTHAYVFDSVANAQSYLVATAGVLDMRFVETSALYPGMRQDATASAATINSARDHLEGAKMQVRQSRLPWNRPTGADRYVGYRGSLSGTSFVE